MYGLMSRSLRLRVPPILQNSKIPNNQNWTYTISQYSTDHQGEGSSMTDTQTEKLGGFAKAFNKYTAPVPVVEEVRENRTFANLLRTSKFVDLGDPEGKIVTGEIFQVVNDDLYVDFGWKFHCVCNRPTKNAEEYVRGAKVRLAIHDLELSSRFIGSDTDLTLLEADCRIINIIYSPARR